MVIYPYEEGREGRANLIPEARLRSTFPRIYAYLMQFKGKLGQRKDSRKYYAMGDDWYRHLRAGSFKYIRPPKILVKGINRHPVAGDLAENTAFNGANCPGIIMNDACIVSRLFLMGVFHSAVADCYFVRCVLRN